MVKRVCNILVKGNENFGGFIGYLSNSNGTPLMFNAPLNVSANKYTGHIKEQLVNNCIRDAYIMFGDNLTFNIIDITSI